MRVWAVPNPESTGKYVPAVSTHKMIVGVQAKSTVQHLEILRVFVVHIPREAYLKIQRVLYKRSSCPKQN